jgi:hypothetical protein
MKVNKYKLIFIGNSNGGKPSRKLPREQKRENFPGDKINGLEHVLGEHPRPGISSYLTTLSVTQIIYKLNECMIVDNHMWRRGRIPPP